MELTDAQYRSTECQPVWLIMSKNPFNSLEKSPLIEFVKRNGAREIDISRSSTGSNEQKGIRKNNSLT